MPRQPITISGFPGGVNQRLPATDIIDVEVAEARNMELDRKSALRSRNGLTDRSGATSDFGGAITSIVYWKTNAGSEAVFVTAGAKIWRATVGGNTWTDITGGLSLPSGTQWYWAVLNDMLIGVNGGTGAEVNPIKIVNTTSNAQALGGSPPKASRIAVMDNRVFLVPVATPNVAQWCAIGDPEDWTTTGKAGAGSAAVGGNEGDRIVQLVPHRGFMWFLKRNHIYYLRPGSPVTDTEQWTFPQFIKGVGTVHANTVQVLMDDLIFLSDYGVVSLQAVEQFGGYKQAVLSDNILDLIRLDKSSTAFASVVDQEAGQYWLKVPTGDVWVMDFSGLADNRPIAWTQWDGAIAGSAFGTVFEQGRQRIYVGGTNKVYRYGDLGIFTDAGATYTKSVRTKAYSLAGPLTRMEIFRFGAEFGAESGTVVINATYRFDQDDTRTKLVQYSFTGGPSGLVWDEGQWDVDNWASESVLNADVLRTLRGGPGRRGQTIDFHFHNSADAGFRLKHLYLEGQALNHLHVED